jgi:hypothetical protein
MPKSEGSAQLSRRDWIRAIIGPLALGIVSAVQGVRVTGPVTVALAHPKPAVTLVIADVLAALALGAIALFTASALVACRPPLIHLAAPVAASQLPMALVALLVGRTTLGHAITQTVGEHGDKLLKRPGMLVQPLILPMGCALLLTTLAVALMFLGYRRATRAQGWRLYLSFAGGLLLAELLCRVWLRFAGG